MRRKRSKYRCFNINRYLDSYYREKYPELYSVEFEEFCQKEIIPVYKEKIYVEKPKYLQIPQPLISMFYNIRVVLVIVFLLLVLYSVFKENLTDLFKLLNYVSLIVAVVFPLMVFYLILVLSVAYFEDEKAFEQVQQVKKYIYPKLFSYYKEFQYLNFPSETENFRLLSRNCLMLKYRGGATTRKYDDSFIINRNGVDIYLREINLNSYAQSYQNRIVAQKGGRALLFRIKLSKKSFGRTFVLRRILENLSGSQKKYPQYQDITLESNEFNEYFRVFTTNPQEARLFLTPAFMSRLIDFVNADKMREINISIENRFLNLVVVMDEFEMFEIDGKTMSDLYGEKVQTYRNILIDLHEALSILDEFNIENVI